MESLVPLEKNCGLTDEQLDLLADAEDKLLSKSKERYTEYTDKIRSIVEPLDRKQQKFVAKFLCPIVYRNEQELKNIKRHPFKMAREMGLDRVWRFHYTDKRMREKVVQDVLNDPDTTISDVHLIRKFYREIMEKEYMGVSESDPLAGEKLKMQAARALEQSHRSGRVKPPQIFNVDKVEGDLVHGRKQQLNISNPEAIPGFNDPEMRKLKYPEEECTVVYVEDLEDDDEEE